jgi:hypothetical protein
MHKFYFWILSIIVVALILMSKSGSAQSQYNYYTICNQRDVYYNANPDLKNEEDGGL